MSGEGASTLSSAKLEANGGGGGGSKPSSRLHVQMLAHLVILLAALSLCYRLVLLGHVQLPLMPRWRRDRALAMALGAVPRKLLKLNAQRAVECPKVLVLRTPKTASSTLAALFFLRRVAAGRSCATRFFAAGRYMRVGQYTLTAELLAHSGLSAASLRSHTAFVAHMNYTPALRARLDVARLYRLATLREPQARAESLFAYEAGRPHVRLRPALEYLGAPRLRRANSSLGDELPPDTPQRAVARYAAQAVGHWHLLLLVEEWHVSLAVLMHDLRWRLVDVLGPSLNVHRPQARAQALSAACIERLANASAVAHFAWVLRVDRALYAKAAKRLRARFRALPAEYRRVPAALRALAPALQVACPTLAEQKQLSPADMQCIRAFRRQLLRAVGAPAAAR